MFRLGGTPFRDRRDAGRQLAAELEDLRGREDLVVVALPRGGVPVGYEVAEALGTPLAALIVRKLGAPGNPELAIGALASDGTLVIDKDLIAQLGISESYVQQETDRQQAEIARRLECYEKDLFAPEVRDRIVIVVDDGVATGSTVEAALRALRQREPRRIILAVPVGSRDVLARLGVLVDRVVAVTSPEMVFGVGAWYADFSQTTDEEVVELLRARQHGRPGLEAGA